MKAHLLYPDRDWDAQRPLRWNQQALTQDLALDTLFNAMGRGDKFIIDVARRLILSNADNGVGDILYRQNVLRDCLKNRAVVRELYAIAVQAVEEEKRHYMGSILSNYPGTVLRRSVAMIEAFLGMLKRLSRISEASTGNFHSEGWCTFFSIVQRELDSAYFVEVEYHLNQLKFRRGMLLSTGLDNGNKARHYVLRRQPERTGTWLTRLFAPKPPVFEFTLHPRDESGARILSEVRDQGIAGATSALAQSADHVHSFFSMLRAELAFYVGCIDLHEQLTAKGEPTCFPVPTAVTERRLSFQGLYDGCLALNMKERVVGTDANADRRDLVIVTGANQGGKSTFLRSVGLAQLMMQCGMFVPATAFCSSLCDGIFTHYKREEDTAMKSGKLDEELRRMSDIVDHVTPHSMILFNESFAATNEREGSEIARQILSALIEKGVKIVCVTHLYELAHGFWRADSGNVLFLRAERQADGTRTFKLVVGQPLQTSFGEDLYRNVFGTEVPSAEPGRPASVHAQPQ